MLRTAATALEARPSESDGVDATSDLDPNLSGNPVDASDVPPTATPDIEISGTEVHSPTPHESVVPTISDPIPSNDITSDTPAIAIPSDTQQSSSQPGEDHLYARLPPVDDSVIPDGLPHLGEIMRTRVSTMTYIPKGARNEVSKLFAQLLFNVAEQPDVHPRWVLLMLAPKCILAALPRSGRRHHKDLEKKVRERIVLWKAGDIARLWMEASTPAKPAKSRRRRVAETPPSQDEVNARRCLRLVQEGQYSRAVQALTSRGIDQESDAAREAMKEKHPAAPIPRTPSDIPPAPPPFNVQEIRKAILSFNTGSAPGPSGLRAEHLKKMISSPDPSSGGRVLAAITRFVNVLAAGNMPSVVAPYLCGANLFAILKKDGGFRPVAVGETWRRLVCKCLAFKFTPKVSAEVLQPQQLGVGVRGGVEAVVHSVRAISEDQTIPADQRWGMQLDFRNAFNSLCRETIFQEARNHCPEISRWIEKAYGCYSYLNFGRAIIFSQTGTQQGCPLASLLFALGISPIQKKLTAEIPTLLQAWIHDDATMIGSLDDLRKAYTIIEGEGERIGLKLAPAKSSLWNSELQSASDFNLIPQAPADGFELLGTPIGSATFCNSYVASKVAKISDAVSKLPGLQDSHVEFVILRSCLGTPKINFCTRTCPPDVLAPSYESFDGLMRDTLGSILGSQIDNLQWMQASLPVSMGGLGLRNASSHAAGAYAVSIAHSSPIIDSILGSRPSRPSTTEAVTLLNGSISSSTSFSFDDLKKTAQIHVTHAIDLRQQELTVTMASTIRDKARLGCVSLAKSGDWLNAIPSYAFNLHMPAAEFRATMKYRLGIPLYLTDGPCPACEATSDVYSDHAIACGFQGDRNSRHNIIRDEIFNTAKAAGLRPTKEELGIVDDDNSRPADIKVPMWIRGKDVAFDVTVSSPLSASYVERSSRDASYTLNMSADNKHRKHGDACRRNNVVF